MTQWSADIIVLVMEKVGGQQIKQKLLQMFIKRSYSLLPTRSINNLMHEEGHSLENLFYARHDPLFLENVTNKQSRYGRLFRFFHSDGGS